MRWYAVILVMFVAALGLAAHRCWRLRDSNANVPIVTLLGPTEVHAGERTRFGVLVRDRAGVPIPDASVSVGFERNGFDEAATATTGLGGEAFVDIVPPFAPLQVEPGDARLLRAHVSTPIGRASDDHWITPRLPPSPLVSVSTDAPSYAPGETVHVRAVVEGGGVDSAQVSFEHDETAIVRIDEKISPFGVVVTELPLDASFVEGTYVIRVTAGDRTNRASFDVVRRATPQTMSIVFETLRTTSTCQGTVRATWPRGQPIRDAHVRVRLDPGTDGVRGTLDRDGRFAFTLDPKPLRRWCWGPLIAEVERGGTSETVTEWIERPKEDPRPSAEVTVYPEGGVLVPGAKQRLFVRGQGTTIRLGRATGTTDTEGIAALPIEVPGEDFSVEVTDGAGEARELWLHPDPSALFIETGDRGGASVKVYGAHDGERVVLQATKGEELLALVSGVVRSAAQGVELELPLRKDVEGLVWLQATSPSRAGRRLVSITVPARRLHLSFAEPSESYPPRATAKVEIAKVDDEDGQTVKAELGVEVREHGRRARVDATAFERSARDYDSTFPRAVRDDEDVRALAMGGESRLGFTLARLARHEPPWSSATTDAVEIARLGRLTYERERLRTRAWLTIALAAVALVLFAPFLNLGLDHLTRRGRPHEVLPREERDRRRREIVGVSAMWAVALAAPPIAAWLGGGWSITAAISIAVVAVMLRRARLPLALALGLAFAHAACALGVLDRGEALGSLLYLAADRWAIPLLVLIPGQLVIAVLGVVRVTSTEPTTLRDRRVRFFESAIVAGLPITLGLLGYGFYLHLRAANVSPHDFAARTWSPRVVKPEPASLVPPEVTERVPERPRELVHWQPLLTTDANGKAALAFPTGDRLRRYDLEIRALGRSGALGASSGHFDVGAPVTVWASAPAELVRGDEVEIPITLAAYGEITLTVTGLATVTRKLSLASDVPHTELVRLRAESEGEQSLRIEATSALGRDAVERKIRVVPNARRHTVIVNGMTAAIDGGDPRVEVYGSRQARLAERHPTDFASAMAIVVPAALGADRANLARAWPVLLRMEVSGGGFSRQGAPPASPELSAQALLALTELAHTTVIDPAVAKRTRAYLKTVPSGDFAQGALVAWALAPEAGSRLDDLEARRAPTLEAYEIALAANAFLAGGRNAKAWLDMLAARAIVDVEAMALAAHAFVRAGQRPDLAKGLRAKVASAPEWSPMAWRALYDEPAPPAGNEISVLLDGAVVDAFPKLARDARRTAHLSATKGAHTIEVRGAADARITTEQWTPGPLPAPVSAPPELSLSVEFPRRATLGAPCPAKVSVRYVGRRKKNVVVEIPIPGGLASDANESRHRLRIDELGLETGTTARDFEIPFVAAYAGSFTVPFARAYAADDSVTVAESASSTMRIE